jgi:hypothetical protein
MHTLVPVEPKLYRGRKPKGKPVQLFNVVHCTRDERCFIIEPNLSKQEALKMVNYLNGGFGNEYGQPVVVEHYAAET